MWCEGLLAKRLEPVGAVSNTPSFDTQAKSNDTTSTRMISFVPPRDGYPRYSPGTDNEIEKVLDPYLTSERILNSLKNGELNNPSYSTTKPIVRLRTTCLEKSLPVKAQYSHSRFGWLISNPIRRSPTRLAGMQWTAVEIKHTSPEVPARRLNASLTQNMTAAKETLWNLADTTKAGRMALDHGCRPSFPVKRGHNLIVPSSNLLQAPESFLLQAVVFPVDVFLNITHPFVEELINIKSRFVGPATQRFSSDCLVPLVVRRFSIAALIATLFVRTS